MHKIISITPNTTGTQAVFTFLDDGDTQYTKGQSYKFPVIAWAIVENLNNCLGIEPDVSTVHGLVTHCDHVEIVGLLDPECWRFEGYE